MGFGEVTSLIFLLVGTTSPFLLGDSSIVIRAFVVVCGLPCLILVLFLVLQYRGDCLSLFLLGLTMVLKVSKVVVTSCSVGLGEKIAFFGGIYVSMCLLVFLGLDFSCFSPSSSSSCSFPTSASCSSTVLSTYVSISSYSDPTTSSSYVLAPYSSSSIFPSIPPTLEPKVSPGVGIGSPAIN